MTKYLRVRTKRFADSVSPADGEREIGYGNPPKAHQFKPGESGNPKGRPKGAKNEASILQDLLHRKISVRMNGRIRRISVIEAIHWRIMEDSLRGNTKSAAFILNRLGSAPSTNSQQSEMTEDDHAILESFAKRLIAEQSEVK